MSKKFKLTERRFLTAKLWALGESGQWGNFRGLSDPKAGVVKSVNAATFAKVAFKYGQPKVEVARYVGLVANKEARFRLFIQVGDLRGAAEESVKAGDPVWGEEVEGLAGAGAEREVVRGILQKAFS